MRIPSKNVKNDYRPRRTISSGLELLFHTFRTKWIRCVHTARECSGARGARRQRAGQPAGRERRGGVFTAGGAVGGRRGLSVVVGPTAAARRVLDDHSQPRLRSGRTCQRRPARSPPGPLRRAERDSAARSTSINVFYREAIVRWPCRCSLRRILEVRPVPSRSQYGVSARPPVHMWRKVSNVAPRAVRVARAAIGPLAERTHVYLHSAELLQIQ
ncbi:hypothetical protein EVAR_33933_1 [Eumeta japonica]|uniref:Uncharacterized protein n=1 Tax=Eumeta variegata TaxID=151549 RepID=A0A4C1W012_EUMVA|nr:hypothetical protein EVAR_33933_1 [Eumeta japonica]